MSSTPIVVRTAVLAMSEPIITVRRGIRSPITPPTGEHCHLRQRPGGEGEAECRRAAAGVEDREGDRERRDVRPDVRDRTGREEVAERGQAERAGHRSDRDALRAG
jgi:hypothetical protein